jgi:hypothetical protein
MKIIFITALLSCAVCIEMFAQNMEAMTTLDRGWAYFNNGDYDKAIADFDQAIRLYPNYVQAYINRGITYEKKGDYDRAIADYELVLQINPNHANAKSNLAQLTQARNEYAQMNYLSEDKPVEGSLKENKTDQYIFKPAKNGSIIFKSYSSDENTRHYLAIYDCTNRNNNIELALSEKPFNIIKLDVSVDKEYLVYVQPAVLSIWSADKYILSVGYPKTASESDFAVTLSRDNKTCVITRYVGSKAAGIIIIPGTIQGLPVSEIAKFAFSNENHYNRRTESFFNDTFYNSGVIEVVIPESVKIIGDGAFFMNRMSTVTLPNSITTIGNSAFDGCSNLKEITLPNNVTNYGRMIFQGTGLKNVIFPSSMKMIPSGLFNSTQIESVIIPDGITEIGENAFANCRLLSNVTLPSSIRNIGNSAFSGCTALSNIVIPRGVASIGIGAFNGCTSLTSIIIPEGINTINERTFSGCTALQNISLPSTIKNINAESFAACKNLKEINVPNNVSKITWGGMYRAAISFFDTTTDTRPFRGIVLSLAIQAKLRQLGYEFHFDS